MNEVAGKVADWLKENDDHDPIVLAELKRRVAKVAAAGDTITYGDLAKGVEVQVDGDVMPLVDDVSKFTRNEIAHVGDLLCRISAESYVEAGLMASVVVVGRGGEVPGKGFFAWAKSMGAIRGMDEETKASFCFTQRQAARRFFSHPDRPWLDS